MDSRYRDWAGLPWELLDLVLNKLSSYREYRSFCLVCKTWLSVVREHEKKEVLSLRHLLLMSIPYLDEMSQLWSLANIMNGRWRYRLGLSSLDYKSICGSTHGWLAFVDHNNNLILLNPFSRRTILLPSLKSEFESSISKVVLASNPDLTPQDCLVAVIYGEHSTLAFTKLGRNSWTYVERTLDFFNDAMFDGDRLIAVDLFARVISLVTCFDLPHINASKVDVVVSRCMTAIESAYIVRSCRSGAMMMVRRNWLRCEFQIFKLVEVDKRFQWEEIKSLEDEILFVGLNHTVSLSCLGIFSALPNRLCITGHMVNGFMNFNLEHIEERPPKLLGTDALWKAIWEGLPSPPKLDKLFCLDDDLDNQCLG